GRRHQDGPGRLGRFGEGRRRADRVRGRGPAHSPDLRGGDGEARGGVPHEVHDPVVYRRRVGGSPFGPDATPPPLSGPREGEARVAPVRAWERRWLRRKKAN